MRLILQGPPGSGKGTQAKLLSQRMSLRHIGTGDMLREAIRLGTDAGKQAEPFLKAGRLVPDDIVNEIVNTLFRNNGRPDQFVMDGYPRTVAQASSFDQVLRPQHLGLNAVVRLIVPDDEIVARVSGRWTCPNPTCNATYHTLYRPPKVPGVCDLCKTPLMQRADDSEETVRARLRLYHETTAAVLDYYRERGLLREVPGSGDVEVVYNRIVQAL
jgi:adenylate kinase